VTLDANVLSVVAVAGAGVGAISLAVAIRANARTARMRRVIRLLQSAAGREHENPIDVAGDVVKQVERLDRETGELYDIVRHAVQRVGLVRFDAFEDMGGHLSFCAAMLDADGNGVVLTSINGRTENRIYAKPVEAGASRYHLSEEEQEAIRRALASGP
jgi:hypothetical protein